jgi:hypothetical protein
MPLERTLADGSQRDIHYHLITKDYVGSAMVVRGRCFFAGIVMTAMNGDADVEVVFNIWDSDGTLPPSGVRLVPRTFKKVFRAGEDNFFALSYDPPVRATRGIYVELASVTGRVHYQVLYDQ